jgi:hypothetical protein
MTGARSVRTRDDGFATGRGIVDHGRGIRNLMAARTELAQVGARASSRIVSSAIRRGDWCDGAHRAAVDHANDNTAVRPSTAPSIHSRNERDEGGSELCPSPGDTPPDAVMTPIKPVLSLGPVSPNDPRKRNGPRVVRAVPERETSMVRV